MKRIVGLLSAVLLAVSSLLPLSVIRVNAEQYGWVDADTDYFLQSGHSVKPDAIRIELAYTAGMHAYSDDTVFGDPEHYGYRSEVIELWRDTPKTWDVGELYIDYWEYYDSDLYTQSSTQGSSEYPFVSWDEYPEGYGELLEQHPPNDNMGRHQQGCYMEYWHYWQRPVLPRLRSTDRQQWFAQRRWKLR